MIKAADRLQDVGEYYFSLKLEEVRKLKATGADVINLGIGSPDLTPSSETLEATARSLKLSTTHGYATSRGTPELREGIRRWYQSTFRVALQADGEVLPLLGSKEGITYISLAFLNPGDEVLIPNPGYPPYGNVAKLIGAKSRNYDLTEESRWLPDFESLEKQDLSKVKLMWVNYPNMPTGTPGSESLFRRLIAFGRSRNILICHDNPYGLVLNPEPRSILEFDPGFEAAIELNSFSKAFNMAGWRIGMVLGKKSYLDAILQVKSNVDSGMFLPLQAGALAALDNSKEWHAERNRTYSERREIVYKIFDHLRFSYSRDQVGLFVWGRAPEMVPDLPMFLDEILYEAHIFIVPGMIFGSNGTRYARISLCGGVDVLHQALARIRGRSWEVTNRAKR